MSSFAAKGAGAAVLALAVSLALAPPAEARASKDWVDWGAVALGPAGAWGLALHYDSERDARAAALRNCHGPCNRALAFRNSCGAVAVARKGADFWAVGKTRDEARRRAADLCAAEASDCRVSAAGCTD